MKKNVFWHLKVKSNLKLRIYKYTCTVTCIHLHTAYDLFCITMVAFSSWDRHCMVSEACSIYFSALREKRLLIFGLCYFITMYWSQLILSHESRLRASSPNSTFNAIIMLPKLNYGTSIYAIEINRCKLLSFWPPESQLLNIYQHSTALSTY